MGFFAATLGPGTGNGTDPLFLVLCFSTENIPSPERDSVSNLAALDWDGEAAAAPLAFRFLTPFV